MLRLVDRDPVQIIRRPREWRRTEAHIAQYLRRRLVTRLHDVGEISTVLTQLEPLVDQLQCCAHFLGCEISRALENPEDAAAIGRHHRPDDPVHRLGRYLLVTCKRVPPYRVPLPACRLPLISEAACRARSGRLPSPLR